jgi:hypothetical protein
VLIATIRAATVASGARRCAIDSPVPTVVGGSVPGLSLLVWRDSVSVTRRGMRRRMPGAAKGGWGMTTGSALERGRQALERQAWGAA